MFHERLAIGVAQHAAFRTCRLRQQNAGMGETGRMELHELAILKLKAGHYNYKQQVCQFDFWHINAFAKNYKSKA